LYFSSLFLQGITTLGKEGLDITKIRIKYKVRERGAWRMADSLLVDPSDPSEVERVAKKYMRKRIRLFDTALNILTPRGCWEAALADGSNTILLIPEQEISIDEELEASVSGLASNTDSDTDKEPKRPRF
jgi:hypothetical protein